MLRPDWPPIIWLGLCHVLGIIGAVFFFSWDGFAVAVALYFLTGMIGITLGFHRLMTHRSFKTSRWMERVLGVCGSLALQKGPLDWVAHHRMHHAGVDTDKDPHNARRGFWWSHVGWMMFKNEKVNDHATMRKFARDIAADPFLVRISTLPWHVGMQVALGLVLLAAGGWSWFFLGVFTRLTFLYHVTWFVNSASHMWGYKNHASDDLAVNCWWVGILAFGEGWHNNHHTFQDHAQTGEKWWEFDLTWQVIKLLAALGLVYDVKAVNGILAPASASAGAVARAGSSRRSA
jgi:stearoyl-CoA desaturase (delta-9 desaturase)